MSATPSVRTAAVWGMAGQYVGFVLQFATSVIISRFFLSPGEVGLFGTALAAAMLVAVFQDFGIGRYVAGEPELDAVTLRRCFSVSLLIAFAVGLVILALAWPAAQFYRDERLFPILAVIAGSYLIVPFGIVPAALLQRRLDFRALFVVNTGASLALAAVTIALATSGWSALSLAWGVVAQVAVRVVLAQALSGERVPRALALDGLRDIMKFGSGSALLSLSGALGVRTPELIIGRMLGFVSVGVYGRAVGLSGTLRQLVSGAIGGVFFPAFARLRDRGEDFAPAYYRVVSAYTVTTWPAMLFLGIAAAPVVSLLYGPNWAAVAPLLLLIAISEIPFTALPLHMDIPIVRGRMRALLGYNLVDTTISVTLMIAAATVSVEWAAASRIVYGVLWFAVYARFLRRLIGFEWRKMITLYVQSLTCSLATIAPLLLVDWQWRSVGTLDFGTLAATALAGVAAWGATLFIVGHPARIEFIEMAQAFLKVKTPISAVNRT